MPYQPINFANIEPLKGSTAIGDLFSNMLKTSKMAMENQKLGRENRIGEQYDEPMAKNNLEQALLDTQIKQPKAKYAEEIEKALLQEKKAHAKYWEEGGRGGTGSNSPKERRILLNALGPDGKAELYRLGNILGWNPQETQQNWIDGVDFKKAAEEKGLDLSQEEGNFLATGAVRTALKNAEGAGAELDYLEEQTTPDLSLYGSTILGYSPEQIADAIKGDDDEKQIKFLGARALQPEIAGARSRVAQGSNAQEALKDAQNAALASFNIVGAFVSPKIREGVQKYINDKLKGGLKARKRAVMGIQGKEKEVEGMLKKTGGDKDPLGLGI
jgi:hypothetical protein